MRTHRFVAIAALALATITLGGCMSMEESRLDEFRDRSEQLMDELLDTIPADLAPETGLIDSAVRIGDTQSAEDKPSDPAWWQTSTAVNFANVTDASVTAAAVLAEHLTSDGWSQEHVRTSSDGESTADGFRHDGWYVEVTRYETVAGKAELLQLLIVSPDTVRGDHAD